MKIQPNFTSKYKYSKNEEERRYNVLKETCQSGIALGAGLGTYSILEAINKNSIVKSKNTASADSIKALAKSGLKRNALIGLAVAITAGFIAKPIMNCFIKNENDENKTTDHPNYKRMKNFYKAQEGAAAGIFTFGVLETIQKFSLAKQKPTQTAEAIATVAKKGLKQNALFGLAAGVLGYAIAWPTFKWLEPTQLKVHEWADKQNKIAEKAEELLKQEDESK